MSESSAQIFAESLPIVSNPPSSTTRSPARVWQDIVGQKSIIARYDAALVAEGHWPPLDARPLDALHYVLSNFIYEYRAAQLNGNT